MEKIQSAIAKARAAREALQSGEAPPAEAGATPELARELPPSAQASVPPAEPATAPQAEEIKAEAAKPDAARVTAQWQALPSFAPAPVHLARGHVVTISGGKEAVPFDLMRTRLLQQMRVNNWRRVAITSPTPGCGKSTVALNLAMSLARQSELRTILAELDMRRPSLAKTLGLREPQNFARVLEGNEPFADHAVRIGANLAISTCQTPHRHPAELLHNPSVSMAFDQIEAEYDPSIFIFDMPPMFVSDDTMAVMGQMDCVLIIAAAETSKIKEIDQCERELAAQTNVLGVVLNKCRYMEGDSYSYDY